MQLRAAGKPVPKSAANLLIALPSYAVALVQDAVELQPTYPNHEVCGWGWVGVCVHACVCGLVHAK